MTYILSFNLYVIHNVIYLLIIRQEQFCQMPASPTHGSIHDRSIRSRPITDDVYRFVYQFDDHTSLLRLPANGDMVISWLPWQNNSQLSIWHT